jgi:hypothetical protein
MDANGELVSEAASIARPGDATTTGHEPFLLVATITHVIDVVSIVVELHSAFPTFANTHAHPNSTPIAPSHSGVKGVASTYDQGGDHGLGSNGRVQTLYKEVPG